MNVFDFIVVIFSIVEIAFDFPKRFADVEVSFPPPPPCCARVFRLKLARSVRLQQMLRRSSSRSRRSASSRSSSG